MNTAPIISPPSDARILIAMSGGVDSAVAAASLVEQGYTCLGVTLALTPPAENPASDAAQDAARVCKALGIPHHLFHDEKRFEHDVIRNFLREYQAGRTPNPCVRCNRMIKFGALYQHAKALKATHIAMGHYVRLAQRGDRLALQRADYRPKDQSYVLAPLRQPQLQRACFPLGGMTKQEVRERAQALDMVTAQKKESQDICFVPDGDYARFIESRSQIAKPGYILNRAGEKLGRHKGLIHYTIGQRRGLGIAAPRPLYVLALDVAANALIVGEEEETYASAFSTLPVSWGGLKAAQHPFECLVQIRARHQAVPATVRPQRGGACVQLHQAQQAITTGQWAVFYDAQDFVLGAAVIRAIDE